MLWDDKVTAWRNNEVTKAFFCELKEDLGQLAAALYATDDVNTMLRLQGMVRSLRAVIDAPEKDGIREPSTIGVQYESDE